MRARKKFARLDGCSPEFRRIDAALNRAERGISLAVVLPRFPSPGLPKLTESDVTIADSVRRYFEATGVEPVSEASWSCGCGTQATRYTTVLVVCGRHRGALLGRDPKTGEYDVSHSTREFHTLTDTAPEVEPLDTEVAS